MSVAKDDKTGGHRPPLHRTLNGWAVQFEILKFRIGNFRSFDFEIPLLVTFAGSRSTLTHAISLAGHPLRVSLLNKGPGFHSHLDPDLRVGDWRCDGFLQRHQWDSFGAASLSGSGPAGRDLQHI